MNELLSEFADDGSENVGRSELVDGLSEGDEDEGDLELVVGEVSGEGRDIDVGMGRNEGKEDASGEKETDLMMYE